MLPDVISYTIPCCNRQADLDRSLPSVIAAAMASPPVEVVVVDYANDVELTLPCAFPSSSDCTISIVRYRRRQHYHMAHARNLSVKASTGEWVVISSADICPSINYFQEVRQRLAETKAEWLAPDLCYVGMVVCRRKELVAAGGFDERFEFYGSEDKDLRLRLQRRGLPSALFMACDHVTMFRTTNWEKVKNYRLKITKTEMLQRGKAILTENVRQCALTANEGQAWGSN